MSQYLSPMTGGGFARSRSSSIDLSSSSVIFVNVARSVTNESPPTPRNSIQGSALKSKLDREFSNADFVDTTTSISHDEIGSFWDRFESSGRHLPDQIQNLISATAAPIVVLCHGLAGLIALQITKNPRVLQQIAAFVLIGTPTNFSHKNFSDAIRYCAKVDFGEEITKTDLATCKRNLENIITDKVVLANLHMIQVYEGKKCSHRRMRQLVIDKNMASFPGECFPNSHKICSETEHCTMSDMDLTQVIHSIRDSLASYSPLSKAFVQAGPVTDINQPRSSASELRRTPDIGDSVSDDASPPEPFSLAPLALHTSVQPTPPLSSFRHESPPSSPNTYVHLEPRPLSPNKCTHHERHPSHPIQPGHLIGFPLNPDFFGRRAKLEEIHEFICSPTYTMPGPRYLALYGLPGMGKTQLARQFVEEVANDFKFILWVDASSGTSIETGYAAYAKKLSLVSGEVDIATSSKALWDWFNTCEEPYFVVLDNATDIKEIARRWPSGRMASVLVTTVRSEIVYGGEDALPFLPFIQVDKLEDKEAIEMVLKGIPDDIKSHDDVLNRKEAGQFVQNVKGTALAVSIGIAVIKEDRMKLATFNKRFSDDHHFICKMEDRLMSTPYDDHGTTIKNTIRQLLEQLPPKPRCLINVMSLLHTSRFPESLEPQNLPGDLRDEPFLRGYNKYRHKSINNLLKGGGEEGRVAFELHGLTSRIVREVMEVGDKRKAMNFATRLILRAITQPGNTGESPQARDLKLFEAYNMHIESIIRFCEETWKSDHKGIIPRSSISLLARSSWLCYSCGFLTNGLKHIKLAETLIQGLDDSHPSEEIFDARMRLAHASACIATEMGLFGLALRKFTEENDIIRQAESSGIPRLGGPGRLTKISGGIANSYQGLGRHDAAIHHYEKCLKGPPEEQSPYNVNICRSFIDLGQLDVAERRLEQLVKERELKYGKNDSIDYIAGHQKYILGNVRIRQNRLDEAFDLHHSALHNWEKTKGTMHHKTGDAWHKMGWHYCQRHKWADALDAFRAALDIYCSSTNQQDQSYVHKGEIARTNFHLSRVLHEMGQAKEADEAMKTSLHFRGGFLAERAMEARHSPQGREAGNGADLTEKDFDDLVSLWVL